MSLGGLSLCHSLHRNKVLLHRNKVLLVLTSPQEEQLSPGTRSITTSLIWVVGLQAALTG